MRLRVTSSMDRPAQYAAAHALGFGSAMALAALAVIPVEQVLHGPLICPFKALMGIDCPTCGLTRSVSMLIHGDLVGSIRAHHLGLLVAGAMAIWALDSFPIVANAWKRFVGYSQSAVMLLLFGNWLILKII